MNISKKERLELDELSKTVFGARGRWRKILDNGHMETLTQDVEQEVPGKDGEPATTRTIKVPVPATKQGGQILVQKYVTFEELKKIMLERKAQIDEFLATLKKQQEDALAKKAQEDVIRAAQDAAAGSAL